MDPFKQTPNPETEIPKQPLQLHPSQPPSGSPSPYPIWIQPVPSVTPQPPIQPIHPMQPLTNEWKQYLANFYMRAKLKNPSITLADVYNVAERRYNSKNKRSDFYLDLIANKVKLKKNKEGEKK